LLKEDAEEEEGGLKELLPHRRRDRRFGGDILKFRSNAMNCAVHLRTGPDDGPIREIGLYCRLSDSETGAKMNEFAGLLTIALKRGATLEECAEVIERDDNQKPRTVFGEALEALSARKG
jgi:hypothetical protein